MRICSLLLFCACLVVAAPLSAIASDIVLVNRGLDSGRLAFTLVRGEQEDVYVLNFADGTISALVASGAKESQPAWAPSGKRIAYSSNKSGSRKIYLSSDDGSGSIQLTSGEGDDEHPSWSPDETMVVFQTTRFGPASDIFMISINGTGEQPLVVDKHENVTPTWSPSGRDICFSTNAYWPGWDLLTYNLEAKHSTLLSHGERSFKDPAWSPDAASIAVAHGNGVEIDIWTVTASTHKAEHLIWQKGRSANPVWAAGGRYILFTNELHVGMKDYHVFLYDISTGTTTQITKGLGYVRDLSWTDTNGSKP